MASDERDAIDPNGGERAEAARLVRAVKQRLEFQADGGVSGLPRRPLARKPRAIRAPEPTPAIASEPLRDKASRTITLPQVRDDLGDCRRCKLHAGRTNIVFGVGNPNADLVFVGEGPGAEEDRTGEPFVGAAGQLLTKMIQAMGFAREDVYICNVVKCRPPGNRNPEPDEIAACEPFLVGQLGALAPRMVVTLGKFAAQCLLRSDAPISALRGHFHRYQGIALMPTFHPAYLLRNPSAKREVWADLQQVMAELDRLGVKRGTPTR